MKRIVISVGGNALSLDPQKDSKLLEPIAKLIVKLYDEGYQILLTTGNGPQSGEIFNSFVDANKFDQKHISYKLDEANAMSQGYIGYHVLKALENESLKSKIKIDTACLNTLTIVDEHDKA
jgi:carbamate kinase